MLTVNEDNALKKINGEFTQSTNNEQAKQTDLRKIYTELLPNFGVQWNIHSLLAMRRHTISRVLYLDRIYKEIVGKPGVILEFGVHWGASMATLVNLRGIYEPYNHSRKIVGFDTFSGFSAVNEKDGRFSKNGDYSTSAGHEVILDEILAIHESFAPNSHMKKFELVKGDASGTFEQWLTDNPHAVIAMAIFDMDVYKPTRDVLEKLKHRLFKGSVLVFDELNCPHFPGETIAVNETLGLNNLKLNHFPHQPYCSFAIYGE